MSKILFIVNVDWFFLSHRLPLATEIIKRGFETHLACTLTSKKSLFNKYGIITHDLKMERSSISLISELIAFFRMKKIIDKVKPDIIHLISIKPIIFGGLISRMKRIKNVVISVSGLGYVYIGNDFKTRIIRLFISLLYRIAIQKDSFKIIFQNHDDLNVFLKMRAVKKNNTILIKGSGVDLFDFLPSVEPKGIPIVILVSRMLIDKGVREFSEAAKILKNRGKNIRMILVGCCDQGNPKTLKKEEIENWISKGYIEYWGYKDNISDIMKRSNIVVLPSYREGMPKSLLEAAASARAVITTNVPGCRDAIIPDVTGVLVPAKNAQFLADAIDDLINHPEKRCAMGKAGRKFAEESFDIRNVIDTHLRIYDYMVKR